MSKPKVLILRTAGTNCDRETAAAFSLLKAGVESIHINEFLRRQLRMWDYQILAIPGGFTYGDDIAAGKILANELKMKLGEQVGRFLSQGGLIIGICNGFQVLVKMGILPGTDGWRQEVSLGCNDSGKFEDRWVHLRASEGKSLCVWTSGLGKQIYLPVAHGEGKFVPETEAGYKRLEASGQIVLKYCDKQGGTPVYPDNPNGSYADVAGICDSTGRVFGLMPHPERFVLRTQHPRWTRGGLSGDMDGLRIFKNALKALKKS